MLYRIKDLHTNDTEISKISLYINQLINIINKVEVHMDTNVLLIFLGAPNVDGGNL